MRSFVALTMLAAVLVLPCAPAMAQNKTPPKPEAVKVEEKQKRAVTPAQQAMRDRQKACAAEWKTAKANKTAGAGSSGPATWPKFWSECNKRLKQKQS